MANFLTGEKLSAAIRDVLSGTNLRCAVAFWGHGAADLLRACAGDRAQRAKIICDISMGGTFPGELIRLGAPRNERLRHHIGLHAKVYLSDNGAIVGSANASSNGIGFADGVPSGLSEAGLYCASEVAVWKRIEEWFDSLYREARPIDQEALESAWERWSPGGADWVNIEPDRSGSLLNLVLRNSSKFSNIGFLFVKSPNDPTVVEEARAAAANEADIEGIENWSRHDMFTRWNEDLLQWPRFFFEFWMPRERSLSVFGREMIYIEPNTGTVFAKKSWRDIRNLLKTRLPSVAQINETDAGLAGRIIIERGNILFPRGVDVCRAIAELA